MAGSNTLAAKTVTVTEVKSRNKMGEQNPDDLNLLSKTTKTDQFSSMSICNESHNARQAISVPSSNNSTYKPHCLGIL